MKILVLLGLLVAPAAYALEFSGNSAAVIEVEADSSTGLEGIYVLDGTSGVKVSYAYSGSAPHWQRFSSLGGAYAEDVTSTENGSTSTITLEGGDMGYIVECDGRQHCFWIVDYSGHELELGSITPMGQDDCSRQQLAFTGAADEIAYYTINGRRMTLSRDLEVEYSTLIFDEEAYAYTVSTTTETVSSIGSTLNVAAPLTATSYVLSGDRFLRAWGRQQSIQSASVDAYAVEAQTRATQEQRDNDNEQKVETDGLGGSAPCVITFEAAVTDAAIYHEWQTSSDSEFETIDLSFPELTVTYTFEEQGTTYIRFVAANGDDSCQMTSDTYEVTVGESKLDIPNAFSPLNQDGVNDLWKVSYKSLTSYECHIFNRWGQLLFSSTNPAEGWDGRKGGKLVQTGVYYYVIKAVGSDGVKYDKAGDINIIGYSESAVSSGTTEEEE